MSANANADLELMRASTLLESDPAAAARRASAVIALVPGHPQAILLLATACARLGDASQALTVLEPLVASHPDALVLVYETGRAYASAGRGREALEAFKRVVMLDPGFADGWRSLAAAYFANDDEPAGDAAYVEYHRLVPDPPELADVRVAIQEGRLVAADGLLQAHLSRHPDDPVALRAVAEVAFRLDNPIEAESWLRRSLAVAPGYADARYDLARVLFAEQRFAEAMEALERLLRTQPSHVGYRSLKAQTLRLMGRTDEAVAIIEAIVSERPTDASRWLLSGQIWRDLGRRERAVEAYRKAIELRPGYGDAYLAIADLKSVPFRPEDISAMRALVSNSALYSPQRAPLEFALGKGLEDAGEYEESFRHYEVGNYLRRTNMVHDAEVTSGIVARSKAFYTAEVFSARRDYGIDRLDPIFIVGLPRSGSTLIEQILASHPEVEGTRELPDLPEIANEVAQRTAREGVVDYPAGIAALTKSDIDALAARYLERTQSHRRLGKPRFVDKMLGNHLHVGLIHLMFPRAAIIDARRHPLGCGFSCFRQSFGRTVTFAYDLAEIGRYYREYADVMAHFDVVLPGRVHRLHYEQLVTSPEQAVRRLLDYCGLPFDEACLRFYDTKRVVHTISSEQVRQPIYADSVDQWRHYEPWLGPLKAELGDLVDHYPAA